MAQANPPVITSIRMPNAQLGETYDAELSTRDGRAGDWSAVSQLPAGLQLDPGSGALTGVLTGDVGDRAFTVRFTDGQGRTAVETIRLYVFPSRGLEGGSIQITLTWESAADLDLHVNDAWGEDIWYGHQIAESGGELDYDANAACEEAQPHPTENTHWPYEGAPDGRYDLRVEVFDTCGTSDLNWTLTARVNGVVVLSESDYGDSVEYYVWLENGQVTDVGTLDRRPARRRNPPKT